MPTPFRSDLQMFLREFVDEHRGVRLGQMFGVPAGYVGRKLFVCLKEDGVLLRLPDDVARREIRARGTPHGSAGGGARRGRGSPRVTKKPTDGGAWVMYRPRTVADARRLVPLLETAARHVAEGHLRHK